MGRTCSQIVIGQQKKNQEPSNRSITIIIIIGQVSVMIRRRSTMDHSERIKHNKLVEMYAILDLCLQLPSEDRITLRNQVKAGDEHLIQKLNQCKKDKNYHQLQIHLRKFVQKLKQNDKYGGLQMPRNTRGKTPQTLKSTKNPTDSSYHNSRQNSFQSSPSAKKTVKVSLTKDENDNAFANQINTEIPRREITPREIMVEIRPLQVYAPKNQQIVNSSSIKNLLKSKISDRFSRNPVPSHDQKEYLNKENWQKQARQNSILAQIKVPLTLSNNNNSNNSKNTQGGFKNKQKYEEVKYGQFYKRIKKVIEQAH